MSKMFSSILTSCLIGLMMLVMLIMPNVCIEGATAGLLLWFHKLLPSLLPFIILMNMLCQLGIFFRLSNGLSFFTQKLFHISGTTFMLFLLGLIGGYPMGAKLAKELLESKQISFVEAEKSLCFGTNCGPIFIIGTVGTMMLNNISIGYFLFFVHILSAFIMLLLSRFYTPKSEARIIYLSPSHNTTTLSESLTRSVQNAMDTIVYVGGYIIFFSVVIHILKALPFFNSLTRLLAYYFHTSKNLIETIFLGSLEFSNGAFLATNLQPLSIHTLALLSGIIAFGGFCVFFQCGYVLQGSNLSLKTYLIAKLSQGLIAYLLTLLFIPLFSSVVPIQSRTQLLPLALPLILLFIVLGITILIFKLLSSVTMYRHKKNHRSF